MAERDTPKSVPTFLAGTQFFWPPSPKFTAVASESPDSQPISGTVPEAWLAFQPNVTNEGNFVGGGEVVADDRATLLGWGSPGYFSFGVGGKDHFTLSIHDFSTISTQKRTISASMPLASEEPSVDATAEDASQAMLRDVDLALARLEQGVGRERTALDALLHRLTGKPA